MVIGYIGIFFMISAYACLAFKRSVKYFLPLDIVGSLFLTAHAILIKDVTFIFINAFITLVLSYKMIQGGIDNGKK
jgi:hypothetical protein